ncbi:MAG: bestrophin family ion channel [Cytophagales bacterium]|nr:bestrophin family ion channel [Cytophagales bacterium]
MNLLNPKKKKEESPLPYNPHAWFGLIFNMFDRRRRLTRHVVAELYPLILFMVGYSIGVHFLFEKFPVLFKYVEGTEIFLSSVGLILGFLLVFRANTAYDKWWEGRKIWGQLLNDSRALAAKMNAFVPLRDHEERRFFGRMICNFAYSLKGHLRKGVDMEELIFEDKAVRKRVYDSKNKPNMIGSLIYEKIGLLFENRDIPPEHAIILDKEVKGFMDHLGACERIKNTPIPYSYSSYIKKFIFVYSLLVPLELVIHLHLWTVLGTCLVFYILAGLEMIAEEVEEPFGESVNDLTLDKICSSVRSSVEEVLGV